MKFVFLIGGFTGFLVAFAAGWAASRAPDRVLFDAMLGALAGAFLFRWYWSVVAGGLRDAYLARQRAASLPVAPAVAVPAGGKAKT